MTKQLMDLLLTPSRWPWMLKSAAEVVVFHDDTSARRAALTLEINALAALQIKAARDATFLGWRTGETAAYEERSRLKVALRKELSSLDEPAI